MKVLEQVLEMRNATAVTPSVRPSGPEGLVAPSLPSGGLDGLSAPSGGEGRVGFKYSSYCACNCNCKCASPA